MQALQENKACFSGDSELDFRFCLPQPGEAGLDLHFCFQQKLLCCRHRAGGKQMSTGHLHLDGFESCFSLPNKKERLSPLFFIWCGQQDSNLHALAVEPKSTESTNSTMPAYSFVPLIFTRRGIRGGAFRLTHYL